MASVQVPNFKIQGPTRFPVSEADGDGERYMSILVYAIPPLLGSHNTKITFAFLVTVDGCPSKTTIAWYEQFSNVWSTRLGHFSFISSHTMSLNFAEIRHEAGSFASIRYPYPVWTCRITRSLGNLDEILPEESIPARKTNVN
jgi:hypothetical protein